MVRAGAEGRRAAAECRGGGRDSQAGSRPEYQDLALLPQLVVVTLCVVTTAVIFDALLHACKYTPFLNNAIAKDSRCLTGIFCSAESVIYSVASNGGKKQDKRSCKGFYWSACSPSNHFVAPTTLQP